MKSSLGILLSFIVISAAAADEIAKAAMRARDRNNIVGMI